MHFPTCNVTVCVLFYPLFNSDVGIVNIKDSISTRYKRFKIQEIFQNL